MKRALLIAALAMLAAPGTPDLAFATSHESATGTGGHSMLADGEIRKVDRETKKLTIRHGPIESLDMPAMTMVFQVRDVGMLDRVKTGDKVRFTAENSTGVYIVTHIEPAQ